MAPVAEKISKTTPCKEHRAASFVTISGLARSCSNRSARLVIARYALASMNHGLATGGQGRIEHAIHCDMDTDISRMIIWPHEDDTRHFRSPAARGAKSCSARANYVARVGRAGTARCPCAEKAAGRLPPARCKLHRAGTAGLASGEWEQIRDLAYEGRGS
jgi:hypothetical protein